jgi:hypothetical protein
MMSAGRRQRVYRYVYAHLDGERTFTLGFPWPYSSRSASSSTKLTSLGAIRTTGPCVRCNSTMSSSHEPRKYLDVRHKPVTLASRGPGILLRG